MLTASRRMLWGVMVCGLGLGCGHGGLRLFNVTYRTVRNCHPAGLIPQLCEDKSTFEGKTRTGTVVLEMRDPNNFIFYDEEGRGIPGRYDRGTYFARSLQTSISGLCEKTTERSLKFRINRDYLPNIPAGPRTHEHHAPRMVGTIQERAGQNEACGQPASSKLEEEFEGEELPAATGLPVLGGGA